MAKLDAMGELSATLTVGDGFLRIESGGVGYGRWITRCCADQSPDTRRSLEMLTRYLLLWLLLAIVAIANGIVRQSTYGKAVSDLAAHQISTVTAILAFAAVVWIANRFWPIESASQAWTIGFIWLAMTVAFEFGFGHYVAGHSWDRLLMDYNILRGRVWALVLVWVTIMPFVIFKLAPDPTA